MQMTMTMAMATPMAMTMLKTTKMREIVRSWREKVSQTRRASKLISNLICTFSKSHGILVSGSLSRRAALALTMAMKRILRKHQIIEKKIKKKIKNKMNILKLLQWEVVQCLI